jgi:hypothetical protein
MRGVGTVIAVAFFSIILFGIIAPAVVEPMAQFVLGYSDVIESQLGMDMAAYTDNMYSVVFLWAPLIVLGSGVVSAIVWYTRRERVARRRA